MGAEQRPRPLVIVDLPSTPNPGEAMRQLLMRAPSTAALVDHPRIPSFQREQPGAETERSGNGELAETA